VHRGKWEGGSGVEGRYVRRHNITEEGIFIRNERGFEARLCFFEVLHRWHDDDLMGRIVDEGSYVYK
jgi:hypothetical protein